MRELSLLSSLSNDKCDMCMELKSYINYEGRNFGFSI